MTKAERFAKLNGIKPKMGAYTHGLYQYEYPDFDARRIKMTSDSIKAQWNKQADEYNQWDDLGEDEKIEWAYELGYNNGKENQNES